MINNLLGTENPHDYYVNGYWNLEGYEGIETPIRPDTICKIDEANIIVIDSKYYTHGYYQNGTLPGTSDMQKQITYAKYIKDEFIDKNTKVYNAFILPKNSNYNSQNKDFNYIGYCGLSRNKTKTKNKKEDEYQKIYTFLINLRKLVEGNLNRDSIIKIIKEEISKHQDIM